MSEAGQSADRLRTGLQAIASWIGLRRSHDIGRGEDLLLDPGSDSVEFTSLSPFYDSRQSARNLSLLTDAWIRRHCDPVLYELAETLVKKSNVVLVGAGSERLNGKVCDGEVFSVEIWWDRGGLAGSCQCEGYRRHTEKVSVGDQRLACAHIVALAHYLVLSGMTPHTSPGELASLCPITRLPLDSDQVIYRCERCQLSFSKEGWQFLKAMDRGRCCGCRARNCIHAVAGSLEIPRDGAIS